MLKRKKLWFTIIALFLFVGVGVAFAFHSKSVKNNSTVSEWLNDFTEGNIQECNRLSNTPNVAQVTGTDDNSDLQMKITSTVAKHCVIKDISKYKEASENYTLIVVTVPKYSYKETSKLDISDLITKYKAEEITLDDFKEQTKAILDNSLLQQLDNWSETEDVTVKLAEDKNGLEYTTGFTQKVLEASNVSNILSDYKEQIDKYMSTVK